MVYNPKAFIPHAVSLRQGCPHCGRFPVAATRRCRLRVSVTLWGVVLSHPLPVIALVSHYLTNKLIGSRLLLRRINAFIRRSYAVLPNLSAGYSPPKGRFLPVTHPSATRRPRASSCRYRSTCMPKAHRQRSS